jgi:hypothetical protein
MPQRLRAVVESELGLKILLGFVGVLFFLLGWTIAPVLDEDADVSMPDAGSLPLVLLAVGSPAIGSIV